MSIYTVTIEQQSHPKPQAGHKEQHTARGATSVAGFAYPDLYVEVHYKIDSITKLINPANLWTKDCIILASQFKDGLSDNFHAPTIGLDKQVRGPLLTFKFRCTMDLLGSSKLHLGFKDIISLDREIKPRKGIVIVEGWVNTVKGTADFKAYPLPSEYRMRVD